MTQSVEEINAIVTMEGTAASAGVLAGGGEEETGDSEAEVIKPLRVL